MTPSTPQDLGLDYRAIGLSPRAADIVIFFVDLFEYGLIDRASLPLLSYLAEGRSAVEIAAALGTSERTANRRIAHLREQLSDYALASG